MRAVDVPTMIDQLVSRQARSAVVTLPGGAMLIGKPLHCDPVRSAVGASFQRRVHTEPLKHFLKLALRAQSSVPPTPETLAAIKSPC